MSTIPVFLSSDEKYAPFVAVTIASICYNTKAFVNFYILDGGITNFSKRQIRELENKFDNVSIEFIEIDVEKEFASIEYQNIAKYISVSTYNRFLIPELKPYIKKAIYLDVDLIVLDDIKHLFDVDLGKYALGAFSENMNFIMVYEYKKRLQLKSKHKYFNAGVLLLDCEKWRNENIKQKCFAVEKEYRDRLKLADQDVLNVYFNENYRALDVKFNLMTSDTTYYDKTIKDLLIRHFNSTVKPWNSYLYGNKPIKHFNEFWFFASMTTFYQGLHAEFLYHITHSDCKNNQENHTTNEYKQIILGGLREKIKRDFAKNKQSSEEKDS